MQTTYSPPVLVNSCTNSLEHAILLRGLVKVLQTLQVGLICSTVVVDCKSSVRTRACYPLVYAALDLCREHQQQTTQQQTLQITLTAVSTNARAGRGNGLNHVWCLMPSSFLFANHMVLMIFCMIGALRKPRRSSCRSALCCPQDISHYNQHAMQTPNLECETCTLFKFFR